MLTTRIETPVLLLFALLFTAMVMAGQRLSDLNLNPLESDLQPSVILQEHDNRVVEEYRVNNKLYMVKITPSVGAPYYLIDDDGSGDLEYRRDSGGRDIRVPQWVLFSW